MEQELHDLLHRLYDAIPPQQEDLRDFLSSEYEMIAAKSIQLQCCSSPDIKLFLPLLVKSTHRTHQHQREAEQLALAEEQQRQKQQEVEFQCLFEEHRQRQRDIESRRLLEQRMQEQLLHQQLLLQEQQQYLLQQQQQQQQQQCQPDNQPEERRDDIVVYQQQQQQQPKRPPLPMTEEKRKKIERAIQFERQLRLDLADVDARQQRERVAQIRSGSNQRRQRAKPGQKKSFNNSFLYNDIEEVDDNYNDYAYTTMMTTSPEEMPMTPCTPCTPMTIDID